jgi:glycosyltransferase involved in cell wall biosynthesis
MTVRHIPVSLPTRTNSAYAGGAHSAGDARLWIGQLAPPLQTVPPSGYGGTERVVSALTDELARRGHDVTLFASGDSVTAARLVPTINRALWHNDRYRDALPFTAMTVDLAYQMADYFDVIHNHLGYPAFPMARAHPATPTLTTLHGRLDQPELEPLDRQFDEMPLVSISDAQRAPLPWANWVATVYHGIPIHEFPFRPSGGEYLAFLGRIAPEKGLDMAIGVARRAGMRLRIAARMPRDQPHNPEAQRDWRYFHEAIEPHLSEPGIEWIGDVAGGAEADLLGGAAALLFPIRWPEPFGLVMAEALACGTPVLALRRGSVPEVVEHGLTGFVADTIEDLVRAIGRLSEIDRRRCRAAAETRFSTGVMVDQYEAIYGQLLGRSAVSTTAATRGLQQPVAASEAAS